MAGLAERPYGVVARRQLLALGLETDAVGHRRLQRSGHWMATVLAAGPGAVLSHRDAAALHGLRRPHEGRAFEAALNEAERQNVLDVRAIEAVLERTRGRRGSGHANLRAVLREHADHGPAVTRSELERRFLDYEVDACWSRQRLIVELDGWQHHRTREEFEADRERDATLEAAGWRVVRVTDRQLRTRTATVLRNLRALVG